MLILLRIISFMFVILAFVSVIVVVALILSSPMCRHIGCIHHNFLVTAGLLLSRTREVNKKFIAGH